MGTTTSREQVLTSVKGLLTSGAYSDLVVTCGSDSYKVHKNIVCERAGFFARAVRFGGQEAQTGTIDLPEDEPEIVKLLLQYLYEGEYDPVLMSEEVTTKASMPERPKVHSSGNVYSYAFPHTCDTFYEEQCEEPYVCPHHVCRSSIYTVLAGECNDGCRQFTCKLCTGQTIPSLEGDAKHLLTHAKMYEIADKYDVIGLKDLAKEKFSKYCEHFWSTPEFVVAAKHAFSTTIEDDTGLRDIVSATISEHIELVDEAEVKLLMTQFNSLAIGVLMAKKEHGWGKKK